MTEIDHDFEFMQYALAMADEAERQGEVPVGAVVVHKGRVIGSGFNQPISATDCTAHAEIIALRNACAEQNNYRLSECDMYVTLEPCAMCAGAIVHARIRRLIFAASDPKTGACGSVFDVVTSNPTGHRLDITAGVSAEVAQAKIQDFFKRRRAEKKQQKNPGGEA